MKTEKRSFSNDQHKLERAREIAIDAFAWLAGEPERISGFLESTGMDPAQLRNIAGSDGFLAAVLDYLCASEPDLLAYAANSGRDAQAIDTARQVLAGPPPEWGP